MLKLGLDTEAPTSIETEDLISTILCKCTTEITVQTFIGVASKGIKISAIMKDCSNKVENIIVCHIH